MNTMPRLLFLKAGPYFVPSDIPMTEKYRFLSKEFSGDIIAGVVHNKKFKSFEIGNFTGKGLYLPASIRYSSAFRGILFIIFALTKSIYSNYFNNKYNAIITYDPLVTGMVGLVIGKMTGAKVIVEVNGNYEKAFATQSSRFSLVGHLKHIAASRIIPFVLKHADGIKLVHKEQLTPFKTLTSSPNIFIFPNFVPISQFKPENEASKTIKYILFLGFPWHLKGVDILIKAFNRISSEFPDVHLKIVGHCPDKTDYIKLCKNNEQIELSSAVHYDKAIMLMNECYLFVLPSRTDSSPRVLREAMAAKKPIVASNVDGIPELIKHGENGLLFESENIDDLADKIRLVLKDAEYAGQLAENGYRFVYNSLSEKCYMNNFSGMIAKVLTSSAKDKTNV